MKIIQAKLKLFLKSILAVLCIFIVLLYWASKQFYTPYSPLRSLASKWPDDDEIILRSINLEIQQKKKSGTFQDTDSKVFLRRLSSVVQNQLTKSQNISTHDHCKSQKTLLCGHSHGCGLGCQIHHRTACVMVAYALNIPLIHDELPKWPYTKKWNDIFQPLGSNCSVGQNTYKLTWQNFETAPTILKKNKAKLEYPLSNGIPIPKQIAEILQEIHSFPWLWWVGQFLKYAMRLAEEQVASLELHREEIAFSKQIGPIVGIQVRRTDKLKEANDSVHSIEEYFNAAEDYFNTIRYKKNQSPMTVFIASDSHLVLKEAKEKYKQPKWNVLSFPSTETLVSMHARSESLDTIVHDLFILSECDYVICGFSSNICTLLVEMLSYQNTNALDRVKSLDVNHCYKYWLLAPLIPQQIYVRHKIEKTTKDSTFPL